MTENEMTKRELFAMAAMQGMLTGGRGIAEFRSLAGDAFMIADAMIKAGTERFSERPIFSPKYLESSKQKAFEVGWRIGVRDCKRIVRGHNTHPHKADAAAWILLDMEMLKQPNMSEANEEGA